MFLRCLILQSKGLLIACAKFSTYAISGRVTQSLLEQLTDTTAEQPEMSKGLFAWSSESTSFTASRSLLTLASLWADLFIHHSVFSLLHFLKRIHSRGEERDRVETWPHGWSVWFAWCHYNAWLHHALFIAEAPYRAASYSCGHSLYC